MSEMTPAVQADAMRKLIHGTVPVIARGPLLAELMDARYEAGAARTAFNVIQILAGQHGGREAPAGCSPLDQVAEYCAAVIELTLPAELIYAEVTQ